MIALLTAFASQIPLPSDTAVQVRISEVRVGHAVVQKPATNLSGSDSGWDPNLSVTVARLIGPGAAQLEFGVHGAIAHRPWTVAELRLEPRFGVRFSPALERSGPFLGVGMGLCIDAGGRGPTGLASVGWAGFGARRRPVLSMDGRLGVGDYGGTGILASVGLQWMKLQHGVR